MKVTREHLRGPWNDGSIVGFIHKRTAEDLLLKCQRGTFLLRFSDSELGEEKIKKIFNSRCITLLFYKYYNSLKQVVLQLLGSMKEMMEIHVFCTFNRSLLKILQPVRYLIVFGTLMI